MYKKDDTVLVFEGGTWEFENEWVGLVVGTKQDTDGTPLVTVEDSEGDCFDLEPNELGQVE